MRAEWPKVGVDLGKAGFYGPLCLIMSANADNAIVRIYWHVVRVRTSDSFVKVGRGRAERGGQHVAGSTNP